MCRFFLHTRIKIIATKRLVDVAQYTPELLLALVFRIWFVPSSAWRLIPSPFSSTKPKPWHWPRRPRPSCPLMLLA